MDSMDHDDDRVGPADAAGAVELRVLLDQLGDPVVGPVDGAGERLQQVRRRGRVEAPHRLDRGAARDVPAGGTAHAVRHHQEVAAREAGVLVVLAHPADVGEGRVAQREPRRGAVPGGTVGGSAVAVLHGGGQRYFLSSRTVFPMRTWLPSWRVVGWVRRCDPM